MYFKHVLSSLRLVKQKTQQPTASAIEAENSTTYD